MKWIMALMLIGVMTIGSVAAFGGFGDKEQIRETVEANDYDAWKSAMQERFSEEHFDEMVARYESREAVRDALEANDYDAWVEAVEDHPRNIENIVNEDNFDVFVEMHEAREAGDYDTARQLREELGLPMMGKGFKHRMH